MIRNLKALLAAALALTALGAIAASAHAEDEFHCSLSFANCRGKVLKDGTGATAHHVFIIEKKDKSESVSFTCAGLTGTAEFVSATDVSLGWNKASGEDRLAYEECKVNGSPNVVVHMNSCKYTFTAGAGGRTTKEPFNGTAQVHVVCLNEEEIEVTIPNSTCVFDIPSQTLGGAKTEGGIGYHNIGAGTTREVTVTANVHGIEVRVRGDCSALIKAPANELEGTYTTGNTIVTGQTAGGVMAEAWFE